ncbi:MAG: type II secretion system F family protein [Advenella sp.]|uniref:type II secretion system F family protein n=1 Tax=Advenella sp. TaxID=1872388 RepID=UPI00258E22FB|nr:type II secretion system F family protein [Advenella sp.]MDD3758285.1 type II secretion system F family protein [Advenella sp.]
MNSGVLLALMALVLLVLAFVLLYGASQQGKKNVKDQFVLEQLERRLGQEEISEDEVLRQRKVWKGGPRNWNEFLLRAGVIPTTRFYVTFWLIILIPVMLAWVFGGIIAAGAAWTLMIILSLFRLWLKGEKQRKDIVRQLPDFLDRVVRMMTIGNSMGSAFHNAVTGTELPLRDVIDRAVSLNRSGKEIDVALHYVSRQYGLHELYLLASVIGVALKYGGRSDQVLERMSAFMRDLEQARAEMKAMSAELRLSAWVLALLPVGLACFILVFNNALFMGMWDDPAGKMLLMGAGILQISGSYWLYRLAKSI